MEHRGRQALQLLDDEPGGLGLLVRRVLVLHKSRLIDDRNLALTSSHGPVELDVPSHKANKFAGDLSQNFGTLELDLMMVNTRRRQSHRSSTKIGTSPTTHRSTGRDGESSLDRAICSMPTPSAPDHHSPTRPERSDVEPLVPAPGPDHKPEFQREKRRR
jgi:hypothetical protein